MKILLSVVCLFLVAGLDASPVKQERLSPMMNIAEGVAKQAAVHAAKQMAESVVDGASNVFNLAASAGEKLEQMWQQSTDTKNKHEDLKIRRSSDPLVDEMLRKRIASTFKELDTILAPIRQARDEGGQVQTALASILGSIIGVLKSIPALAPILEFLQPFLSILGI